MLNWTKKSPRTIEAAVLLALAGAVSDDALAAQCNGGATLTSSLIITTDCDGNGLWPLTLDTGAAVTVNAGVTVYNDRWSTRDGDPIAIAAGAAGVTLANYGLINTDSQWAVTNNGQMSSLLNAGTIRSGMRRAIVLNNGAASIDTLTNIGLVQGPFADITNGGTIGTLNNLQGTGSHALTVATNLPLNYNVIIQGAGSYGQLSNLGATGSMAFNIYGNAGTSLVSGVAASTLNVGTYAGVLQGFNDLGNVSGTSGIHGSFRYSLVADLMTAGLWDLVVSLQPVGIGPGVFQSADLNGSLLPAFDGGTLQVSSAGTIGDAFPVTSNGGVIDHAGRAATFSGILSGAGGLTITNTGSGGNVTFSAQNTYTGATVINAGAALALAGNGSLVASAGVVNDGEFDISGAASGTSITTLSGAGVTRLGSTNLTLSTASTTFAGVISGSGGVSVAGGSLGLSAANTFTGATTVGSGATLALIGNGSVAGSDDVINNGTFDISGTTAGASVTRLGGNGATVLGAKSLTVSNGAGNYGGTITGGGGLAITGGTQALSGVNAYTGVTAIAPGATLALTGVGDVAASAGVVNNGRFDISGAAGASVTTLSGAGETLLGGGTLALTNASTHFAGAISGSGGLRIAAGTLRLSGANTFTGTTTVDAGAALELSSALAGRLALVGSATTPATLSVRQSMTMANPITVSGDPVFNVAPGAVLAINSAIADGVAAGDVVVTGGGTLLFQAANTYTGPTFITQGSRLALAGAGRMGGSSAIVNGGVLDVSGASGNVSFAGSYSQSATGALVMSIAPAGAQRLAVGGTAGLAGTLSLAATPGSYKAGRYTLLTASILNGSFQTLTTDLSTVTPLAYSLSYGANDVSLVLIPQPGDTAASVNATAASLRGAFNHQTATLVGALQYDCASFDVHGICVGAGGRRIDVDNARSSTAMIAAAYRVTPQLRVGAYADSRLGGTSVGAIRYESHSPLLGVFGTWQQAADGRGAQLRLSASRGSQDIRINRAAQGTAESAEGSSSLIATAGQIEAAFGLAAGDAATVAPYAGLRRTRVSRDAYAEAAAAQTAMPLQYGEVEERATALTAGVRGILALSPALSLTGSAGLEHDVSFTAGTYTASGLPGLTPVDFGARVDRTRPTASAGASLEVGRHQVVSIGVGYRREAFENAGSSTAFLSYAAGL